MTSFAAKTLLFAVAVAAAIFVGPPAFADDVQLAAVSRNVADVGALGQPQMQAIPARERFLRTTTARWVDWFREANGRYPTVDDAAALRQLFAVLNPQDMAEVRIVAAQVKTSIAGGDAR